MSDNWIQGKLGDFITLQRGYDLPAYERETGTIPVITSSGVNDTHSIARAVGPGVIMGRYGTIGEIYYIDTDYWPHNTTLFVKDFKGNHPHFIYYFLKTLHYQAHNDKTSVPGLNRNDLHLIDVAMPPLPQQQAIAHILGSLDDKIELNRRMNATLEATARALFKSWFVDFDPVHYKVRGEQPPGMDAETAALFPDSFEESELGPIPRGWRVGQIMDLGKIITGKTPPSDRSEFFDGEIPFIRIPDMHNQVFIISTEKTLTNEGASYQAKKLLPELSLCVSCIATPGLVALTAKPSHTNQQINSIICHDLISPFFSLFAVRNLAKEIITRGSGGSATLNLNKSDFEKIPLLLPTVRLIDQYHQQVKHIFDMILLNEYQSRTLAETRDSLLPKLVSGELRVGDVDEY